ncbi:MAG: bifunctional 5,10-methylenetetrahydrofolate dehydrogenase/5,10-methenyltetrahydrofolate cyclohydrolase [Patescibacteria group bacterium]
MNLINGKKIAEDILADLKKEIEQKELELCLAVILAGDDRVSHLYLQKKEEAAQKIGIKLKKHLLPLETSEQELSDLIDSLNNKPEVNGILIQMPLPEHLSADKIIQAIKPEKDVDGFLDKSRFNPPFILAIWQALESTGENLKDKKILALVNSDIFGRKLKYFFSQKRLKLEYLLGKEEEEITQADVIITALGQPEAIKESMIKQGAILIDGGISRKNGKISGDIDRKSVREKAKWLAPVPGGIGPLTVAFLFKNLIRSL